MKKIILLLLLLQSLTGWAQIPVNDPTWVIKKQDDFNSFDAGFWRKGYPWDPFWSGYDGVYDDPNNLVYSGGWLKMKIDSVAPFTYSNHTFIYKGAAMWSKADSVFKYGYYEISAKLPKGYGYWPAFWLWGQSDSLINPGCPGNTWGFETDILELDGKCSSYGDSLQNNFHWWDAGLCKGFTTDPPPVGISPDIDTSAHKYAMWWTPNRCTYYYDDKLIRNTDDYVNTANPVIIGKHPLWIVFDISITTNYGYSPGTKGNTIFPNYFQIDYLKIWQQKTSCGTAENFCSTAFNASTYNYAVKKSVSIGGSGCTASSTINTSSNVALWATDFILIDQGTVINPNGSGTFASDITSCPN